MNVAKLVETFYTIDACLKEFMPYMGKHCLPGSTSKKPTRTCSLNRSEIMTILITFHAAGFRNFKTYYLYLQQCHECFTFVHLHRPHLTVASLFL